MTPTQVKAIVDALFQALETKLASRPILLFAAMTLNTIADGLIDQIVPKVANVK